MKPLEQSRGERKKHFWIAVLRRFFALKSNGEITKERLKDVFI